MPTEYGNGGTLGGVVGADAGINVLRSILPSGVADGAAGRWAHSASIGFAALRHGGTFAEYYVRAQASEPFFPHPKRLDCGIRRPESRGSHGCSLVLSETLKKFHWSLALPSSRQVEPTCISSLLDRLPAEFPPPRVPRSSRPWRERVT